MGKTGYPMYVFICCHTDFLSNFTMRCDRPNVYVNLNLDRAIKSLKTRWGYYGIKKALRLPNNWPSLGDRRKAKAKQDSGGS